MMRITQQVCPCFNRKNAQLLDIILLQLTPYQVFEFQTCVFISFEETSEILINADRFLTNFDRAQRFSVK